MREVTSAIPDILQRTAPSCMRPMYQDLLAHVCVCATWLNLPSIPMASCPRWGTSPPLTRMCLVPRTLTELLLTRSDSSAFGARLPRSQCSQGMGIQDLPAEIQGKHWSLRHFTHSHSIKYLTDNEKGFESRKSIAASPQWFASPTEMAHLQAPLKILSDTELRKCMNDAFCVTFGCFCLRLTERGAIISSDGLQLHGSKKHLSSI